MINPQDAILYIPPTIKGTKLVLFNRIATKLGGSTTKDRDIAMLPRDKVPVIGCSPELRPMIAEWRRTNREFIYWDRGYARRVYATQLPRGADGGYYRWQRNAYQMRSILDVKSDRWDGLNTPVDPWSKNGKHVLVAAPSITYYKFHGIESWIADTIRTLALHTDRPLMIRDKEHKRPLRDDLKDCHALVTHGSNAAVEAAIMGCPVFVHSDSAAALLGNTDITQIEKPKYADRQPWLNSLAYSQWNEAELVDGTLWRMLQ